MVLYNGGTMYIDEGKPLPGAIEATVRNLREVAPNWYFTVPKGYEMLLPYLRADAALRENFFSRLKALWFAGAGVSQHVFDEYKELAFETCGEQILFLTGLGSTETAPYPMARTWDSDDASQHGRAAAGRRDEARADGGTTLRGAAERPAHHARLLAPARAHARRRSTKRATTASATPLRFADPARPGAGPPVPRPHLRGLQALHRHLGARRAAAREVHRALRAAGARRGDRRRRARRARRAGLSSPRPARATSCARRLDASRPSYRQLEPHRARCWCSTSRRRSTPAR